MERQIESPKENYSLEEILRKYAIILIDTSVLINSLDFTKKNLLTTEKIDFENRSYQSTLSFQRYAEQRIFYVTENVFREYTHTSVYHLGQKIKKAGSGITRDVLELIRLRDKERKTKNKLIRTIEENCILHLDNNEMNLYDTIIKQINWLKENYELSDVDADFLTSAITLSRSRGATAMLSNDRFC